nr:MAG TPA: hypothetical protein [Caudoviricetes sp.]
MGSPPAISWGGLKSEKKPAETGGPLLEHQLSLIHPFAFKHLFFNPLPFLGGTYSLSRRTPKVNRRNFL